MVGPANNFNLLQPFSPLAETETKSPPTTRPATSWLTSQSYIIQRVFRPLILPQIDRNLGAEAAAEAFDALLSSQYLTSTSPSPSAERHLTSPFLPSSPVSSTCSSPSRYSPSPEPSRLVEREEAETNLSESGQFSDKTIADILERLYPNGANGPVDRYEAAVLLEPLPIDVDLAVALIFDEDDLCDNDNDDNISTHSVSSGGSDVEEDDELSSPRSPSDISTSSRSSTPELIQEEAPISDLETAIALPEGGQTPPITYEWQIDLLPPTSPVSIFSDED